MNPATGIKLFVVLLIVRSHSWMINVSIDMILFPVFGSVPIASLADAVLINDPVALGANNAVTVSVTTPPDCSLTGSEMFPLPFAEREEQSQVGLRTPMKSSTIITEEASEGPRFVTEIVYPTVDPAVACGELTLRMLMSVITVTNCGLATDESLAGLLSPNEFSFAVFTI